MWKMSSPGAAEPSNRTVGLRSRAGKPANLTLRYCPGRMVDRRIEQHRHFHDVGCERGDAGHQSGAFGDFGDVLERDRRVADDLGLAGEHGALVGGALVVDLTAHDGHAAGFALPRAAVVRNRDPAGEAGVDERLARDWP